MLAAAPPLLLRNQPAEVEIYRGGKTHEFTRPLPDPAWSWSYKREAEAFIHGVRTGEPFDSSGEDTLTDVRLFEEIYREWLRRKGDVSRSIRIVFDGRLPSKTRCGTSQSGVPSAFTSFGRLAERQRFGLREHIRDQHVVMAAKLIQRLGERDEVARNQPRPLVDQLVERVLAVGSRLAPVDRTGRARYSVSVQRDVLPLLSIVNCCR